MLMFLILCCSRKRAESDPTVPDAAVRAEKFAQRYFFLCGFTFVTHTVAWMDLVTKQNLFERVDMALNIV